MNRAADPVGTLDVALQHAGQLLENDADLAAQQATEILKVAPGHPMAMLLLGTAQRRGGDLDSARATFEALCRSQPDWAQAQYELAITLTRAGSGEPAVAALRRTVQLKPDLPDAWRALGDHLTALGDAAGADRAYAQQLRYSSRDPRLLEAGAALCENRIAVAEALLREHLKQHPTDIAAIRMLGEVAARLGRYEDAQHLLERSLELAPSFTAARRNYAVVLRKQNKWREALTQIDQLLAGDAGNPGYRNLKAALLAGMGEYPRAIELYAGVVGEYPLNAKVWMSYGHALKTAGRQTECVAAYRKAIELAPELGEAYWSLANLKTFRFTAQEIATMQAQLARADLAAEDRFHFHFALGKAQEDAGLYRESFDHYKRGNELRRCGIRYEADETSQHVRRSQAMFSKEFFAARSGQGAAAADPVFIVGLPRAGSTLLEQILSSHPLVEGTMELPDIISIARGLGGRHLRGEASRYPEILAELSSDELRALGERYLAQTRIQRKSAAPLFIDKMPNNFQHVGLIHLILPNAKIIDARRHPLGCCFSGFKQHFARGQHFSYDLVDIGRYYRDYVTLMAHFDAVLPGRVHRVNYETLVDDTEAEVRRLLAYCGLEFDARCLDFHQTRRAVRTASSEQVRQPIFRDAVDHWRHYEPWLGPLRQALGTVLDAYPEMPDVRGVGPMT